MTENAAPAAFDPEALQTEYAQAIREETSQPDPGGPTPSEAAGTTPEPTPTDVKPPDSSPAGTTPEGQQPAADVDADFLYALKLAGIADPAKADPKVIGQKLVEFNQRIAAQEKELKAFRAGSQAPPPDAPAPAVAAPVAAQPAPVHADVPAPPAPSADLETRVTEALAQDAPHMGFAAELGRLHAEATVLVAQDAAGNFVGELPALDAEIAALQSFLNPPLEAIKKAGLQAPEIDEFDKTRAENRLQKLEIDRAIRVNRLQELQFRGRTVEQRMEARKEQYRQHYAQQIDQTKRDEELETGIETKAHGLLESWKATFNATATALEVADEDRAELYGRVADRARNNPDAFDATNPKEFMERVIKAEQKRLDDYYRGRQARNGALKRSDTNPSAPTGPGAVAPPLPTSNPDWEAAITAEADAHWRSSRASN